MKLYNKVEGIPQYINILGEEQAQTEFPALPISNDVLVAIVNRAMLASNGYPDKTNLWNKLAPASCNWDLWKPAYQEVYIANRREAKIWGNQEKPFSDIASADETSNTAKKAVNFSTSDHATTLTNKMVDSLCGYLDNLSGAVTNRGSTFEQYSRNFTNLANNIVTLTDTNQNQQAELRDLRE